MTTRSGGEPLTTVRLVVEDGIATLRLARPEHLNAFTDTMETELIEVLDRIDADPEVRVVVLTGEGRAFCAGMDLGDSSAAFARWRSSETAPAGAAYDAPGLDLPVRRDGGGRVVLRLFELDKPVIAAVNGAAVGVGATMVLPCDIRLASQRARFGFVFNRRGLVPESCSTWFLPRVVPLQTALEWVYTGSYTGEIPGLGPGSGQTIAIPGVSVMELLDGLIVRDTFYYDRATFAVQFAGE